MLGLGRGVVGWSVGNEVGMLGAAVAAGDGAESVGVNELTGDAPALADGPALGA